MDYDVYNRGKADKVTFGVEQEKTNSAEQVEFYSRPSQIPELRGVGAKALDEVADRFAFRANDYYLGLVDWDDSDDPIRQLVIPQRGELGEWDSLDASDEAANTVVQGLQHKYADTALFLAASTCAAYCRYCFRKRLFMGHNEEIALDPGPALAYVREHAEIKDVLLTGGDPLVLNTEVFARILRGFASIEHVRTVRIGSKMPAFNPGRILDDAALIDLLARVAGRETSLYFMAHFDHPRELTERAREAIGVIQGAGVHVVNQCPLVRGVNDDADVLRELFEMTTVLGMPQYYLFQVRPTAGNEIYEVPLPRSWQLFEAARRSCSGLSRRARLVMSHATGKIEVCGLDRDHIYLRYHRARNPNDEGRIMVARRDDQAVWFDDLELIG
jgi:lysine 2,3-aminomutase